MDDLHLTVVNCLWTDFCQVYVEMMKRREWSTEDRFFVKLTFRHYHSTYGWAVVHSVEQTEEVRDGSFEDLPQLFAELVSSMTIREDFSVTISQLDC